MIYENYSKTPSVPAHEYAMFYGKSEKSIPMNLSLTEKRLSRYPHKDEKGNFAWANFIRSGSNDRRQDRPKLYYPIFVSSQDSIRIPMMNWDNSSSSYVLLNQPHEDEEVVDQIDEVLAKHNGYTDEELDFIINYDPSEVEGSDPKAMEGGFEAFARRKKIYQLWKQ